MIPIWLNYPQMISESSEELLEHERFLRGSRLESQVKTAQISLEEFYEVRLGEQDAA